MGKLKPRKALAVMIFFMVIGAAGVLKISSAKAAGIAMDITDLTVSGGLAITTSSLSGGTAGAAYTASLTATGGSDSYVWSAAGLPAGLNIESSLICGKMTGPCHAPASIYGAPAAAGAYTVNVTLTSGEQKVSKDFSLVIAAAQALLSPEQAADKIVTHGYSLIDAYIKGLSQYTCSFPDGTFQFILDKGDSITLSPACISGKTGNKIWRTIGFFHPDGTAQMTVFDGPVSGDPGTPNKEVIAGAKSDLAALLSKNNLTVKQIQKDDIRLNLTLENDFQRFTDYLFDSIKLSSPIATGPEPTQITIDMNNAAKDIVDNKYGSILSELKQPRDIAGERQTEIKHINPAVNILENVSDRTKSAVNDFIAYGVDANTVKLGAGERAAVINSYKAAFDKLPETEAELADAIKIANGQFPSVTSETAEKAAKDQFIKIYKRIPDLNNRNDNAAIKVMAYGLRQKAENRNLNSEKSGLKIFKAIYGYTPKTAADWNTAQAIAYSGAVREKDSDGDLLPDAMELKYGTDPDNPDTDGDGFKDGAEVSAGFNPRGAGKL